MVVSSCLLILYFHDQLSLLLKELVIHRIYSKAGLLNHLQNKNPSFLFRELSDLIKQSSSQVELKKQWEDLAKNRKH